MTTLPEIQHDLLGVGLTFCKFTWAENLLDLVKLDQTFGHWNNPLEISLTFWKMMGGYKSQWCFTIRQYNMSVSTRLLPHYIQYDLLVSDTSMARMQIDLFCLVSCIFSSARQFFIITTRGHSTALRYLILNLVLYRKNSAYRQSCLLFPYNSPILLLRVLYY